MGSVVDNRGDLFSTGAILHELLAGQSPFARATALDTMRAVAAGEATPLPPVIVVPIEVRALLDALLAVDRQARPPDAEAALRALRPLLARCPTVDEVVRRLLADPRAFANAGMVEDDTVAGDALSGEELLGGATRDIEALAAGFDEDAVVPAPRPAPRPTPPFAAPPPTSSSPTVSPGASTSLPSSTPTSFEASSSPTVASSSAAVARAPARPSSLSRAVLMGFVVVLLVGGLALVALRLGR
jgi:serine/threonine-protein kinase